MSDFIRQWRKDVRDLGTPEFDAAAALREMMARRADIQRLASEDQRMNLERAEEERKKQANPLNLESKRLANATTKQQFDRNPSDFAILDAAESRRAEEQERRRRADLVQSQNVQFRNRVAAGELPPDQIDAEANQVASMVGAEAQLPDDFMGPPPAIGERERRLLAGEVARGAEVPFDPKRESKREEIEQRKRALATKNAESRLRVSKARLDSVVKSANEQNKQALKRVDQALEAQDIQFSAVSRDLAALASGLDPDTRVPYEEFEKGAIRDRLIQMGVPSSAFRPAANGEPSTEISADATRVVAENFKRNLAAKTPNGVLSSEVSEYVDAKLDYETQLRIFDAIAQQNANAAGYVNLPPARQPQPAPPEAADKPPPPPKKAPPKRYSIPEVSVSGESPPPVEAKSWDEASKNIKYTPGSVRKVGPGIVEYMIAGMRVRYNELTGKHTTVSK